MTDNTNGVKESEVVAPTTQGVSDHTTTANDPTTALLVELEAVKLERERAEQERDNYKKGMLKAKGKLDEQDPTEQSEETLDQLVERKLGERLSDTKVQEILDKEKAVYDALAKRNAELERALANRPGVSSVASGASERATASPTGPETFFSPEQLADLKKRKVDPSKVMANMKKARDFYPGL